MAGFMIRLRRGDRRAPTSRPRWPETLFGFPVETGSATGSDAPGPGAAGPQAGKRGIALIIAIRIISVMMMLTTDMIVNSQVNLQLAVSQRDNLKAEFMAKSAFNVGLMLLSADFAYDLYQVQSAGGKLSDGMGDFWSAINGMPIGGETLEMLNSFQEEFELSKVLDSSVMDQLKLFDGSFVLDVSDEQQKINVNDCMYGRCSETLLMLEALFSCPAEKAFLEKKKVNGRELAYRIKDWVDSEMPARAESESGYNDEDEPYVRRDPQVHAKNAPFDSIDELRMIEGWDEEMQAVFSPYLTVFPLQEKQTDPAHKINLNSASRALLGCLFPESKGDCAEKSTLALKARGDDKQSLVGAGQKVEDVLRDSLCYTGGTGAAGGGDGANKASWFTEMSTTFRIEAGGSVGDRTKKLTAVVQRVMPDPSKNEKASYKVLYWRLL
jgi:general secretion pathway protein K